MTDFNLRHLVREVLAASTMTDPHALAGEVLRRISKGDYQAALRECLTAVVREEIRRSRSGGLPVCGPTPPVPPLVSPRLTLHTRPETQQVMSELPGNSPVAPVKPRPVARPGRSAKVAAIRQAGHRWLQDRINTGADPREWKRVGDCTFADLMFAAGQRREQAARTSAVAERLEALAGLLRVHGVERVRDLPESVLSEAGGAAA